MSAARSRLPDRRYHEGFEFEHGGVRYRAGIGFYGHGKIGEVFLDADKVGSAAETLARDSAVLLSIFLQYGCPLEALRHAIKRNPNGEAAGPIGKLLDLLASHNQVAQP